MWGPHSQLHAWKRLKREQKKHKPYTHIHTHHTHTPYTYTPYTYLIPTHTIHIYIHTHAHVHIHTIHTHTHNTFTYTHSCWLSSLNSISWFLWNKARQKCKVVLSRNTLHTKNMGIATTTFYHEQGKMLTHAHMGPRACTHMHRHSCA